MHDPTVQVNPENNTEKEDEHEEETIEPTNMMNEEVSQAVPESNKDVGDQHSSVSDNQRVVPNYNCGKCVFSSEDKDKLNDHIDSNHNSQKNSCLSM